MSSVEGMSRTQIKRALKSLRKEWETPPTTEQTDLQKELLRGLYDREQDETEIYFYSQDDNGFPVGGRVANSGSGARVYPTLQLDLTVDKDQWAGIERPKYVYPGNWPPDRISDLIPTAGKSEECFKCHRIKSCRCAAGELPTWIDHWQTSWTDEFRIKPAGNRGLGLFANIHFDHGDVLGQYSGELVPKIARNRTAYTASFSIGKYAPKSANNSTCYINAANGGSAFRFLNHSCNPNAELLLRKCGTKSRRLIAVTARREINEGDEITIEYAEGYFVTCLCEQCESRKTKSNGKKRKFEEEKSGTKSRGKKRRFEEEESSTDDTEDSDSGDKYPEGGAESDTDFTSSSLEPLRKKAKKSAPSGKQKSVPSEAKKTGPSEAKKSGPSEAKKSGPLEAKKSGPSEVKKSGPLEVKKSAPSEVKKSAPSEAKKSAPSEAKKTVFLWRTSARGKSKVVPRKH
ncbi:hypothetical protein K505DRAFT_355715 [Melanomma pulvis-pyrius CBS 109.77]|uniref:SET domain-containing protein n=1 Tax=Melanomma pulvis-pyrius CBS 109.77 TaxID=1314802 RepID=A0A6A6XV54_9PLEO|nr:hypothetical protein K505DRAFT_355715 [Melanomma pulvis-pyrius CBS 109.77]